MLSVQKYLTINDIAEDEWDSILSPEEIYNTHRFIRTVEESKIENAEFFYLLFYDDEQLVASTVLSAFKVSLDLFISNNSVVTYLKKIFPKLFTIKLFVCGLPASFGQLNLTVTDDKYADEVSLLIATEMFEKAKQLKISLLAIKELQENETTIFRQFEKNEFFLANSIPYMSMEVRWKNFDEYLSSLRHPYRRRIRLSLKKINSSKPAILSSSMYNSNIEKPVLILSEPDEAFSNEFFSLYLKVMERTTTKLETLNLQFFQELFKQKDHYHLLSLVVKGKTISSAIIIFNNDTLYFMLVGREHEKDVYDSYFNLVYGIISIAIERQCKKIKLGQTAYWVKQCVGATPQAEYIYFASRNKLMHTILRSLRKVIFPELKLPALNIFREVPDETVLAPHLRQSPVNG